MPEPWVIAAVIVAVSRATRRRRTRQAEEIRERAKLETAKVDRRQALADETAAKARAARCQLRHHCRMWQANGCRRCTRCTSA